MVNKPPYIGLPTAWVNRLREFGQDDPSLSRVDGQDKAIEKIGAPQNERNPWTIHKEAAYRQRYVPQAQWQRPQSSPHTPPSNAHRPRLLQRLPVQTNLDSQLPWRDREVRARIE
jgi:hypothetical protein